MMTQCQSKEEAQAALESANASLQQAEINLNYARVTAPIPALPERR